MKNLNAQCPKSAAEIIKGAEELAELSPGLSQVIEESAGVLFLISRDVPREAAAAVTERAGNKPRKIIITGKDENGPGFDFFGVTKSRTPILMDKAFLAHDTVVALSVVKYDGLFGFTGGKSLIFPGLAAEKSKNALMKLALDESRLYKNPYCAPGVMKNNPLDADALDAVMVMRQNAVFFGINLIPYPGGGIADMTCGDIFMSHISAAEKFSRMYQLTREKPLGGITLRLGAGSLQNAVPVIEQASKALAEGGRMFIDGRGLTSFGTEEFRNAFDSPKREEIFAGLKENFSSDRFQAMILKEICGRYHIAAASSLDEGSLRQAGINPLNGSMRDAFLKDCAGTGGVSDAGGFAAGE